MATRWPRCDADMHACGLQDSYDYLHPSVPEVSHPSIPVYTLPPKPYYGSIVEELHPSIPVYTLPPKPYFYGSIPELLHPSISIPAIPYPSIPKLSPEVYTLPPLPFYGSIPEVLHPSIPEYTLPPYSLPPKPYYGSIPEVLHPSIPVYTLPPLPYFGSILHHGSIPSLPDGVSLPSLTHSPKPYSGVFPSIFQGTPVAGSDMQQQQPVQPTTLASALSTPVQPGTSANLQSDPSLVELVSQANAGVAQLQSFLGAAASGQSSSGKK